MAITPLATLVSSPGGDASLTVGTTAVTVFGSNPSRAKFFIKNDSLINVWINFGGTAVAAAGSANMRIDAGGYFELDNYSGTLSAIAESGTVNLTVRIF